MIGWLALAAAFGGEPGPDVVVVVDPPPETAQSGSFEAHQLAQTPGRSVDDWLRWMPGIHASSHGGAGKAYQWFLRGFDTAHGSDVGVSVDGVPLNEPSNVHGHGYLDLRLIPRGVVSRLDVRPGPGRLDAGDFSVAGTADVRLAAPESPRIFGAAAATERAWRRDCREWRRDTALPETPRPARRDIGRADPPPLRRRDAVGSCWHPPGLEGHGMWSLGVGSDRSVTASATFRPPLATDANFASIDADFGNGVAPGRSWRSVRAGVGVGGGLGRFQARAWLLALDGAFESPGALREDDYAAGDIGFYDAYPGSGGGRSSRVLAALHLDADRVASRFRFTVYGGARHFDLRQNFTGFSLDPVRGNATRQRHDDLTFGLRSTFERRLANRWTLRAGAAVRLDRLWQSEDRIDVDGAAFERRFELAASPTDAGGWLGLRVQPGSRVDATLGARGHLFVVPVTRGGETVFGVAPALAPRIEATWRVSRGIGTFFAAGRQVRSPEARGIVDTGAAPLTLADGAELGARVGAGLALVKVSLFGTRISNELLFDHVAARFLSVGTTRRVGADIGVVVRAPIRVESTVTLADGRLADGAPIPYAPRVLWATHVISNNWYLFRRSDRWSISFGTRATVLGPRPLPGGWRSAPSVSVDSLVRVSNADWIVGLDVDNALGLRWRDGAFVYASTWPAGAPASELPVRHFTAGTPFALRLSASRAW